MRVGVWVDMCSCAMNSSLILTKRDSPKGDSDMQFAKSREVNKI